MTDYIDGYYFSSLDANQIRRQSEGFGILYGMDVATQSGLVFSVSPGSARVGAETQSYETFLTSSVNLTLSSNANLPKRAALYLDMSGSATYSYGTASSPSPSDKTGKSARYPLSPNIPSTAILLSEVWIPAAATTAAQCTLYNANKLYDKKIDDVDKRPKIVDADFETGSGWTGSGVSYDTTIIKTGTYSLKLSSTNLVETVAERTISLNLRNRNIRWWQYVTAGANFSSGVIQLRVGSSWSNYFEQALFPSTFGYDDGLWVGSGVAKSNCTYVGNVTDEDWAAITAIRLKITAKASVTFDMYFDNMYTTPTLPKGMVSLSYDDVTYPGFSTDFVACNAKYGTKFIYCSFHALGATIITQETNKGHDVISHGWGHNSLGGEDESAADVELGGGRSVLASLGANRGARFFAWPYGAWSRDAVKVADALTVMSRATGATTGLVDMCPPFDRSLVRAYNWDTLTDFTTQIKPIIDKAVKFGEWVVFYAHNFNPGNGISTNDFGHYMFDNNITNVTFSDVAEMYLGAATNPTLEVETVSYKGVIKQSLDRIASTGSAANVKNNPSAVLRYDANLDDYTDLTTAATDDVMGDVPFALSATGTNGDCIYIGYTSKFNTIILDKYSKGDWGKGSPWLFEFYNGSTWTAISDWYTTINNGTCSEHPFSEFRYNDDLSSWAQFTVDSVGPYYWMRFRVVTKPPTNDMLISRIYVGNSGSGDVTTPMTISSQPDVPRCLIFSYVPYLASFGKTVTATVYGWTANGRYATETITWDNYGSIETQTAFARVAKITLDSGFNTGDAVFIGVGNKIGYPSKGGPLLLSFTINGVAEVFSISPAFVSEYFGYIMRSDYYVGTHDTNHLIPNDSELVITHMNYKNCYEGKKRWLSAYD